jgi:dCTP deaminase
VLSRSSVGRLGILSATATFIHPRFQGVITLELVNTSETPVRIIPGMRIAQLVFEHAETDAGEQRGRYQFSTRPEITLLTSDRELQRLAQFITPET